MHSFLLKDLLHLTNDGCNEKRHTVTDLSARISSVLALHQRPASLLHPVVENELSSVRQVHFDDPSGRRSSTAAAAAGTDCDVVEDNTASPTIVAEERPDVDEATHDQLLVADAISTDEARRSVLLHCEQAEPLPFEKVFPPTALRNCHKIGEGVYGEVFLRKVGMRCTVLKIIPIEGNVAINGEQQKRFAEIISEIVITKQLSDLRGGARNQCAGFVELLKAHCVQGRWPERLIDLWELYDDTHESENDHPEVFGETQLFVVLELTNAGKDLEAFEFGSAEQALAALKQLTLTLAVAEEQLRFEHRDLHWGNILLARTVDPNVTFYLRGQRYTVPTCGVHVTIIDYTLSRINYKGTGADDVLFADLAHNNDLFESGGDYQFEIYRMMRARVDNVWRRYDPQTNVMWLHYVCHKLIKGVRYPSARALEEAAAGHQQATVDLTNLLNILFEYGSATAVVQQCDRLGLMLDLVTVEEVQKEKCSVQLRNASASRAFALDSSSSDGESSADELFL